MWLILTSWAWASGMTDCSASLLDVGPETRILVACAGSTSAPGGPASRFAVDASALRVSVHLRGVELGALTLVEARDDGSAVFGLDGPVWPGLPVEVRAEEALFARLTPAGPDLSALQRCWTHPETCVDAAATAPEAVGPAMRLHACVGGVDCAASVADPLTEVARARLEAGCAARSRPACERLIAVDPSVPWSLMHLAVPGSGKLRPTGVSTLLLPATEARELGWSGRGPKLFAAGESQVPRLAMSDRELRVDGSGVALFRGRRELWRWSVPGVDSAALDDDGQQLLLRIGRVVVWLGFDGQAMGAVEGLALAPAGPSRSGTLIGADGWPRPGVRVSAACDTPDASGRCSSTTDLFGSFTLPFPHGDALTVEDPVTGAARVVAVIDGLPVRLHEGSTLDFEVGEQGRVVRASAPVRPGDVVVAVGPLPVDREPAHDSGFSAVPARLWSALASQWGSVDVIRGGERVTLRVEQPVPIAPPLPVAPAAPEATIDPALLDAIRDFILAHGDRQTYGNRFNDNPHFRFGAVDAYLDPTDPRNTNCDPSVSGFGALVLRLVETPRVWATVRTDAVTGGLRVDPPSAAPAAYDAMRAMGAAIRSAP